MMKLIMIKKNVDVKSNIFNSIFQFNSYNIVLNYIYIKNFIFIFYNKKIYLLINKFNFKKLV